MKRIIVISILLFSSIVLSAQSDRYEQRYNLLVSKLGPAGVGIETLLDNWAKADSTDENFLKARFNYCYAKSQRQEVVKNAHNKYLGMSPLLSLKDSTGTDVYYYQETFFDDGLYAKALQAADRAALLYPDNVEFRFMKANAYISYEKESPDMALAYLTALADEDAARSRPWNYDGDKVEDGFFEDAMLEYCYSFWSIGSPEALEAFRSLSEKMLVLHPDNTAYLSNIGSYHMAAAQNYKAALKCYGKVLKKHPDDYTAIRNSVIAARKMNNRKLEARYLAMLAQYGPENEKKQAQARLEALSRR